MKTNKMSHRPGTPPKLPFSRPGITTLLLRITESALTGGMLWLMFFGGLLLAFLHVNHLPANNLLVLMIFGVLIIALFRGIRSWQDDLEEYQRNLTEYRMNMADNRHRQDTKQHLKKAIAWDRH